MGQGRKGKDEKRTENKKEGSRGYGHMTRKGVTQSKEERGELMIKRKSRTEKKLN